MSTTGGSLRMVRSSNPGLRAVVFGAYGQIGRGVVSRLAGSGVQCMIPWRGDECVSGDAELAIAGVLACAGGLGTLSRLLLPLPPQLNDAACCWCSS